MRARRAAGEGGMGDSEELVTYEMRGDVALIGLNRPRSATPFPTAWSRRSTVPFCVPRTKRGPV